MHVSPPTNMLKNPQKPIETLSTSTYELPTPQYTMRMQHQWCTAMETDVDNRDFYDCDLIVKMWV